MLAVATNSQFRWFKIVAVFGCDLICGPVLGIPSLAVVNGHSRSRTFKSFASKNGLLEVINYLLEKGLTLEEIRSEKNYAIKYASIYGHFEVFRTLSEQGLNTTDVKVSDDWVLDYSIKNNHLEFVKYLCSNFFRAKLCW